MRVGLTLLLLGLAVSTMPAVVGRVQVERLPAGGLQPQAVADAAGAIHIVYFRGDDRAGDLYYVRRSAAGAYSSPLRVNSQPTSAVSRGSVRGAQLALGRGDRIHVIWNGSHAGTPQMAGGLMPLFYSRLTAGAFEPQRNLLTWSGGVDGGGTVVADAAGHVVVAWHANPGAGADARGTVFVARSDDEGATFGREHRVSSESLGACGCCSMRGLIDRRGAVHLLYRAAGADVNRDTMLLSSPDLGATFTTRPLQRWTIGACPMSTFALADAGGGVTAAWDTDGQIFFERNLAAPGRQQAAAASSERPLPAPGETGVRKHPVLAVNARGETLLAWLEGTAWQRGGALAWQLYDAAGRPDGGPGAAPGIPVWGLAAAAPLADGRFLLVY